MEKKTVEVEVIKLTLRNKSNGEKCIIDCYGFGHLKLMVKSVIESSGGLWRVVLNNKFVEDVVEELKNDFYANLVRG